MERKQHSSSGTGKSRGSALPSYFGPVGSKAKRNLYLFLDVFISHDQLLVLGGNMLLLPRPGTPPAPGFTHV